MKAVMNDYPNTLTELVADVELYTDKYQHHRFLFNHQKHMGMGSGQLYLVVSGTVLDFTD